MKKFIPLVLGAWMVAMVGCTTTKPTTTTTTTTREQQSSARMDATIDNTRTTKPINVGPR